MSRTADPLITAGMAVQRGYRSELAEIPAARRRIVLEKRMLGLARTLRESHRGYAAHYQHVGELTIDSLPPITKNSLGEHAAAFCGGCRVELTEARRFLARSFELGSRFGPDSVLFTSSGSTGTQLLVPYHLLDLGRSLEAFAARAIWPDRPDAARMLYIGLMDRHNGGNAWMYHLGSVLDMRLAHLFDPPRKLLDTVVTFCPDVILTRPHMLLTLGRLARNTGVTLPRAHLLSVGDALIDDAAAEIVALWGIRPHNSYSTVETGPLAYQQDPTVGALSVYSELHLVELLSSNGQSISGPGRPGHVAVTTLYRSHFPLVRYLIGDTAEWIDPEMTQITFPTRDKVAQWDFGLAGLVTLSDSEVLRHVPAAVREIQLVQEARDCLLVRYCLASEANDGCAHADLVEDQLRTGLARLLAVQGLRDPTSVTVTIRRVAIIEPDPVSGKVQKLLPLPPALELPASASPR